MLTKELPDMPTPPPLYGIGTIFCVFLFCLKGETGETIKVPEANTIIEHFMVKPPDITRYSLKFSRLQNS